MTQAITAAETTTGERTNGAAAREPRPGVGVCPYCGEGRRTGADACASCGGLFEPLSKQATQNSMGPWAVRDERSPFLPGRSYAGIRALALAGRIDATTPVRGPTTGQFWMPAGETPGVAHLLGRCHACRERAAPPDRLCGHCGVSFAPPTDRQYLGLGAVRPIHGPSAMVASASKPAGEAARASGSGAPATAPAEFDRPEAGWGAFEAKGHYPDAVPFEAARPGATAVRSTGAGGRLGVTLLGIAAAATLAALALWTLRAGGGQGPTEGVVAASPAPAPSTPEPGASGGQ